MWGLRGSETCIYCVVCFAACACSRKIYKNGIKYDDVHRHDLHSSQRRVAQTHQLRPASRVPLTHGNRTDAGHMQKVLPDGQDREKRTDRYTVGCMNPFHVMVCVSCAFVAQSCDQMKFRLCKHPGHVDNWTRETTMCRPRNMSTTGTRGDEAHGA